MLYSWHFCILHLHCFVVISLIYAQIFDLLTFISLLSNAYLQHSFSAPLLPWSLGKSKYHQQTASSMVVLSLFHPLSHPSSSFEGHPLQARHKQNWGRGFILLLPQTAALPGSDAGSDVIKPPSSFVIQNRQTACSMWCPMYGARC